MSTIDPEPQAPESQAIDIVCGEAVGPEAARRWRIHFGGRDYFFCSRRCRRAFRENPGAFFTDAARQAAAAAEAEAAKPAVVVDPNNLVHVCPLTPKVSQAGPGSCPKCGSTLEPAEASESASA